jgi:hypothetical protein
MTFTPIKYIALMGENLGEKESILDPLNLTHIHLFNIGFFPPVLEQIVYGIDFNTLCYLNLLQCEYDLTFVYPNSFNEFLENYNKFIGDNICVFLLCTDNIRYIQFYHNQILKLGKDSCYIHANEDASSR